MTVTLRKPTSPDYKDFSREVKKRAKEKYKNFTYGEEEVVYTYELGVLSPNPFYWNMFERKICHMAADMWRFGCPAFLDSDFALVPK